MIYGGVGTAGGVVGLDQGGGHLLSDHLLWVETLPVGTGADLIDHRSLQVEEDSPVDMLPCSSLREESGDAVDRDGLVAGQLTVVLVALPQDQQDIYLRHSRLRFFNSGY